MNAMPVRDAGEAGTLFRASRMNDFERRIKSLGLDSDPTFTTLLRQVESSTLELEQLRAQQEKQTPAPWWADGEYSKEGADRANEAGNLEFQSQLYSKAFDSFTNAIRLQPSSPVYHCNRAQAALKLGQFKTAILDSEKAIQRDPSYLKAYLKAGTAYYIAGEGAKAESAYQTALTLNPMCKAAKVGAEKAHKLACKTAAIEVAAKAAAALGARPGMQMTASTDPAELLLSAEEMLQSSPGQESLRAVRVEALIYCQRYEDAACRCDELMPGVDRLYLQAQAAWRAGDLAPALEFLDAAVAISPESQKCRELHQILSCLASWRAAAHVAFDDERNEDCIESCTAAMAMVPQEACSGLFAGLLKQRGQAYAKRMLLAEALADLQAAQHIQPYDVDCALLLAKLHKEQKHGLQSFLALQQLQQIAPETPGLLAMLRDAARLCGNAGRAEGADSRLDGPAARLGLAPDCTEQNIRSAHRKLAIKWHPDKWLCCDPAMQADAAKQFQAVQEAFERLISMVL